MNFSYKLKLPRLLSVAAENAEIHFQKLWGYVAIAFNRVDADRLKLVGPDRLCAEWVLKNGGAVSVLEAPEKFIRDYNALPTESRRFHIKRIDASNSSIMRIGLEHLKSCKHIDCVILHECKHLEEDGLGGLIHIKESLHFLEVSSCYNIADNALLIIKELKNLQSLTIIDMPYVKDLKEVVAELQLHLPNCVIKDSK